MRLPAPARMVLAALALAGLAACGNDPERTGIPAVQVVRDALAQGRAPAGSDARETITAAEIDAAASAVLLAVSREDDRGSTLIPLAANLGVVQWTDVAGGGLLTRDGVLVGTRGLGHDLLQADVSGLLAALRAGGTRDVPRLELRLRPDNVVERTRWVCDVVRAGRERIALAIVDRAVDTDRFEERCRSGEATLVNRYWIDDSGRIRRQDVVVGPEFGVLELSLLRG